MPKHDGIKPVWVWYLGPTSFVFGYLDPLGKEGGSKGKGYVNALYENRRGTRKSQVTDTRLGTPSRIPSLLQQNLPVAFLKDSIDKNRED